MLITISEQDNHYDDYCQLLKESFTKIKRNDAQELCEYVINSKGKVKIFFDEEVKFGLKIVPVSDKLVKVIGVCASKDFRSENVLIDIFNELVSDKIKIIATVDSLRKRFYERVLGKNDFIKYELI